MYVSSYRYQDRWYCVWGPHNYTYTACIYIYICAYSIYVSSCMRGTISSPRIIDFLYNNQFFKAAVSEGHAAHAPYAVYGWWCRRPTHHASSIRWRVLTYADVCWRMLYRARDFGGPRTMLVVYVLLLVVYVLLLSLHRARSACCCARSTCCCCCCCSTLNICLYYIYAYMYIYIILYICICVYIYTCIYMYVCVCI